MGIPFLWLLASGYWGEGEGRSPEARIPGAGSPGSAFDLSRKSPEAFPCGHWDSGNPLAVQYSANVRLKSAEEILFSMS